MQESEALHKLAANDRVLPKAGYLLLVQPGTTAE